MMRVRGLSPEEVNIPHALLPGKSGIYFSAVVLAMWDNIHGPLILQAWTGENKGRSGSAVGTNNQPQLPPETLVAVANYSLNDEAGRIDQVGKGIESKFYSLRKYYVIAAAFIFSPEIRGKKEVFSFILILPYSEMSEYLPRHGFCEGKVSRLLQEHLVDHLTEIQGKSGPPVKDQISKLLTHFVDPLDEFTKVMLSINKHHLPRPLSTLDTYLGTGLDSSVRIDPFVLNAITSHLQSSGFSVVIGSSESDVNKMATTLGLFLSDKERKLSRLVVPLEPEDKDFFVSCATNFPPCYEPNLFVQGYVLSGDTNALPCQRGDIYRSKLPCTFIHTDLKEVRMVEHPSKVSVFLHNKEEAEDTRQRKLSVWKDLYAFDLKEQSSRLVHDLLDHLKALPCEGGVREAYIFQFLRHLQLKGLAVAKYLDSEPKSTMQQVEERLVNALSMRVSVERPVEKPEALQAAVQTLLSIESQGDFYIILAAAEKVRPHTYFDMQGDIVKQADVLVKEFQSF